MWFSEKRRISHFFYCLKLISYIRLWNFLLLSFSFFLSRLIKKPNVSGMPWAISVEPSGICNLKCPECPVGAGIISRKGDFMAPALFSKILEDAGTRLMWINFYFQGEPMINNHIFEMIKEASKHNIYSCISTNGHFLSKEQCLRLIEANLSNLIISLDGLTQDVYSKYRKGGDVDKVKDGIKQMVELRQKSGNKLPYITVQFVVFKHNEHEIEPMINWCRSAGVDKLEFKQAQINNFENRTVIAPSSIARFSRYNTLADGSIEMKKKLYNHCFKQWGSVVISWNGQLAPCCYDKDLIYSPGNIKNGSLKDIWYGKSLNGFRNQILTSKKNIDICNNCPVGRSIIM